jgi:hypothetical protein
MFSVFYLTLPNNQEMPVAAMFVYGAILIEDLP